MKLNIEDIQKIEGLEKNNNLHEFLGQVIFFNLDNKEVKKVSTNELINSNPSDLGITGDGWSIIDKDSVGLFNRLSFPKPLNQEMFTKELAISKKSIWRIGEFEFIFNLEENQLTVVYENIKVYEESLYRFIDFYDDSFYSEAKYDHKYDKWEENLLFSDDRIEEIKRELKKRYNRSCHIVDNYPKVLVHFPWQSYFKDILYNIPLNINKIDLINIIKVKFNFGRTFFNFSDFLNMLKLDFTNWTEVVDILFEQYKKNLDELQDYTSISDAMVAVVAYFSNNFQEKDFLEIGKFLKQKYKYDDTYNNFCIPIDDITNIAVLINLISEKKNDGKDFKTNQALSVGIACLIHRLSK